MPRANVFNYYNHRRLLPRITIPSHISKIIMLPLWKIKAAHTHSSPARYVRACLLNPPDSGLCIFKESVTPIAYRSYNALALRLCYREINHRNSFYANGSAEFNNLDFVRANAECFAYARYSFWRVHIRRKFVIRRFSHILHKKYLFHSNC